MHGQFFFLPWITVARVKAFHICTYHTTATVIVGRKIVSQKKIMFDGYPLPPLTVADLSMTRAAKEYCVCDIPLISCTSFAARGLLSKLPQHDRITCMRLTAEQSKFFLTFLTRAKQSLKRSAKCKHPLLWAGKTHGRALFVPGSLLSGLGYCWAWPF